MKTPLGRVLGLGSAKEGTDHWWGQRVTAVALVFLGLWFVISLLLLDGFAYLDMLRFISRPLNTLLLSLLCATMAFHSYLGIQVIIEDYVHEPVLKLVSLLASRFAHIIVGVSAIYAVVSIGLTA